MRIDIGRQPIVRSVSRFLISVIFLFPLLVFYQQCAAPDSGGHTQTKPTCVEVNESTVLKCSEITECALACKADNVFRDPDDIKNDWSSRGFSTKSPGCQVELKENQEIMSNYYKCLDLDIPLTSDEVKSLCP